jgi:hypothetical protein
MPMRSLSILLCLWIRAVFYATHCTQNDTYRKFHAFLLDVIVIVVVSVGVNNLLKKKGLVWLD